MIYFLSDIIILFCCGAWQHRTYNPYILIILATLLPSKSLEITLLPSKKSNFHETLGSNVLWSVQYNTLMCSWNERNNFLKTLKRRGILMLSAILWVAQIVCELYKRFLVRENHINNGPACTIVIYKLFLLKILMHVSKVTNKRQKN